MLNRGAFCGRRQLNRLYVIQSPSKIAQSCVGGYANLHIAVQTVSATYCRRFIKLASFDSRRFTPRAPPAKYRLATSMSSSTAASAALPALVSPSWLNSRLGDDKLRVLDASWYMPNAGRDALQEFCKERIPSSRFFDVEKIADTSSGLPHMLPTAETFATAADALGIQHDSQVVLYDRAGIFSAPRVWWTFRAFGHEQVAVLDGGYPAWLAAGYKTDTSACSSEEASIAANAAASSRGSTAYSAKLQPQLVRNVSEMLRNVESAKEKVIDARDSGRFQGTSPEPRAGIRRGHIPGSLNVPFGKLLKDGSFKDTEGIKAAFTEAGFDWKSPLVTSCGTGVTASILALGLHIVSPNHPVAVYDGSWTEWGSRDDTPVQGGSGDKKQ